MKTKNLYILGIALSAILVLSGCVIVNITEPDTITAKGKPEDYVIKTGEFHQLRVSGHFEIHYFSAASDTVTLSVQPNLREYYTVEVINGELVVRTTGRINFGSGKAPVLTVSTPALDRVIKEGAGTFTAHDRISSGSLHFILSGAGSAKAELDVNNLTADMSGAGEMTLSGRADTINLNLSGIGELDAMSLRARDATVSLSGTGTIRVNSSVSLRIDASGTGSVEYKGSPVLNINRNGLIGIKQVD